MQNQGLRGIDHIVRSEAIVQPARGVGVAGGRHFFGDGGGEGDHVMLHARFNFVDAGDVERGVGAQGLRGVRWNFAGFSERLAGR